MAMNTRMTWQFIEKNYFWTCYEYYSYTWNGNAADKESGRRCWTQIIQG